MTSTIAAIVTVQSVAAPAHALHPGWSHTADGRFFIGVGYPMVAIAVYWLTASTTTSSWEWLLGDLWALAAMVSFVYGFTALNEVPKKQQSVSQAIEVDPGRCEAPNEPLTRVGSGCRM